MPIPSNIFNSTLSREAVKYFELRLKTCEAAENDPTLSDLLLLQQLTDAALIGKLSSSPLSPLPSPIDMGQINAVAEPEPVPIAAVEPEPVAVVVEPEPVAVVVEPEAVAVVVEPEPVAAVPVSVAVVVVEPVSIADAAPSE